MGKKVNKPPRTNFSGPFIANMSVPFSNTHLRVPRGFGTILEGLVREILRDQPEDLSQYAAHYFKALLAQREGNSTSVWKPTSASERPPQKRGINAMWKLWD